MNNSFIVIGLLMLLAALGCVLWPLLKRRNDVTERRRWPTAVIVAVAVPLLAVPLYAKLSNWTWEDTAAAKNQAAIINQMLTELESRLKANPQNTEGWLLLGQSYFQLEQYYRAADAYQKAYDLTKGTNVEAVLGLGESLAFADENTFMQRATALFEQAQQMQPDHPKVLWYTGLTAFQTGKLEIARERWSRLLQLDSPDTVKQLLTSKLAEIDALLASGPRGATNNAETAPAAAAATIKVRVSLAPQLNSRVSKQEPLFVVARAMEGGPPLAVQRHTVADLPLELELSERDAMVAGRNIGVANQVTVVARIAKSGNPQAQSGDLQGQISHRMTDKKIVEVIIDTIVP